MALPSVADVALMIDHAILKPTTTEADLIQGLTDADAYEIFSVCVRPSDVRFAADFLDARSSDVLVGTVIGFPHGSNSTAAKVAETKQALLDGAGEFDVVLNVGWLKDGRLDDVVAELEAVVEAAEGRVVKVIFETDLLTNDEKIDACGVCVDAGVHFVKTSTGFSTGGATHEDLLLMREHVPATMEVKASGGIRGLDTLLSFMEIGVTRFGTSATTTILDDLAGRIEGRLATHRVDESSY